ncbi:SusD/RagB family nutrient-binding outer membrane lipoprotein [Hymenobacter sp. BT664]|uniref:SusD/RagB family nutrient-binding outer membrane lipoprotein n=1 Tax=Hymenobacter montanus TaxID=2771359 RepID=A0A927BDQ6_9BACT|nr:SusD/RagB family nutrient-binding outer membrane lipoprotein [Hymenobacter montanus]MBD2768228.1 SusD/RagB family nutrient-binding outer membrane lipoprotein [Hymenobacter montanus]
MKKKVLCLFLATALLGSGGCNKFTKDYDISPNAPLDTTLPLLMSGTQLSVMTTYTGNLAREAGIFTQQLAGTDQQYATYATYLVTESDTENDFNTIYQGGLINAQEMIKRGTNENSPYYVGIGKILKAMLLGIATDIFGDVPNRQALRGGAGFEATSLELNPTYDTQQVVLQDIQTLLSEGITELQKPAAGLRPGSDDFIHRGDASLWVKTASILKARYANRLSKRDAAGSATAVLAAIDQAGLTGNTDDANAVFTTSNTSQNQFYAFNLNRPNYVKMGARLIDLMNTLNDPRLPFYATPANAAGDYIGTPLGTTETDEISDIGSFFASVNSPVPMVTYVEAKLIEAEAALRAGQSSRAQTAYRAALTAHLSKFNISTAQQNTYLAANGTLSANAATALTQILTQKYIANFLQIEAWSDYRRTKQPSLTRDPTGVISTIPERLPTPQGERINNRNATVVSDLTRPVYWAQ